MFAIKEKTPALLISTIACRLCFVSKFIPNTLQKSPGFLYQSSPEDTHKADLRELAPDVAAGWKLNFTTWSFRAQQRRRSQGFPVGWRWTLSYRFNYMGGWLFLVTPMILIDVDDGEEQSMISYPEPIPVGEGECVFQRAGWLSSRLTPLINTPWDVASPKELPSEYDFCVGVELALFGIIRR